MESSVIELLGLALLGSVAGLIGGVVFLVKKDWAEKLCGLAVPFAAGVLLSVSLLHLLPEAADEIGNNAFVILLVSMLGAFLVEQYLVRLHHHGGDDHELGTSVPLVIFGDTLHNFVDGVAIGSAYLVDPGFGLVVALATFLHETPHEIGDFGVLMSAGWSRGKTFMANLFSALATIPGALLVFFYLREAGELIGVMLAVSAGVFLYLGASDFLPKVGHDHGGVAAWKKFVLLMLGVVIMYGLTFVEA